MGFKSQEPPFVQRARQVACLHMAYLLKYAPYAKDINLHGPQPQPLSVQCPDPSDQEWHGRLTTVVCVTLRFSGGYHVRVFLESIRGGNQFWQWRVLRLDSNFPESLSTREEYTREGKALYNLLVEAYGMSAPDLSAELIDATPAIMCDPGTRKLIYRLANGEMVEVREIYDRNEEGQLRIQHRLPATLCSPA